MPVAGMIDHRKTPRNAERQPSQAAIIRSWNPHESPYRELSLLLPKRKMRPIVVLSFQYSSGFKIVVELRSASVIIQSLSPLSVL